MGWQEYCFEGVWTFTPEKWEDERGYFFESFNASTFPDELRHIQFVQDNEAQSQRNVIRGLHYQLPPYAQSKLVRCVQGGIMDVIVDIRPGSDTFGRHCCIYLDDILKMQLFVPQGFAHGYVALSNTAIVSYKCDNYYNPKYEGGLLFNDPDLAINWKLMYGVQPLVSEKDLKLPGLKDHKPFI